MRLLPLLLLFIISSSIIRCTPLIGDLPSCKVYSENQCSGNQIDTPDSFEDHRWYTPGKGDKDYQSSYQDYSQLVAYSHIQYSSDRLSAMVTIRALSRSSSATLSYIFNDISSNNPIRNFTSSDTPTGPITIGVRSSEGYFIALEPLDFIWQSPRVNLQYPSGDYRSGQKGSIVELFGWPHDAVYQECAFLGKAGYLGVKLFPPQEQIMSGQPFNNILNPWYFMYQPVSYRLQGRMGSRDQLRRTIQYCRSQGVRVYADAVINHMTGGGNDVNPYHRNPNAGCTEWGGKSSSLETVEGGPSPMYTQDFVYTVSNSTGKPASQEFPAAAYGPTDFHCERALNSWTDPLDLNAGWLTGLTDLNTEKDNVRERIAAYLTDLLSIGFSGFRIDAAKHIRPEDLSAIFGKLKNNLGGGELPDDFISWLEILLGGESDLLMCDQSSTYQYGSYLEKQLSIAGLSSSDINKIKVWNSGYPKEPDKGNCGISKVRNAIQNDDADQQMTGSTSRDMGSTGCVLIINCDSTQQHMSFEEQLFNNPNGADDNNNDFPIRLILSSFYYPNNTALGIPDGKSDCSHCTTTCHNCQGVPYVNAFKADSIGYDGIKNSGIVEYTRPHRNINIINAMRKWIQLGSISQPQPIYSSPPSNDNNNTINSKY